MPVKFMYAASSLPEARHGAGGLRTQSLTPTWKNPERADMRETFTTKAPEKKAWHVEEEPDRQVGSPGNVTPCTPYISTSFQLVAQKVTCNTPIDLIDLALLLPAFSISRMARVGCKA